ncbi:ubiquitin-conjugating enzyme/RWD-like protein [Fimicolochytrium jonesii]|uniref:ubiquitin-conjugating enzyme/RWD-like protein n=1 Tax=Fimicolochytrium jonesii TaxID=1396493 RepID=UPI0022FF1FEE|nr:ubiquitin-conjugating enzyme/RWD-like protein [Fimicolochytrium jonesii]KAI8822390.1 ubiquitin-conjugating enzyme/RWD-like protein [Fimicolochytrium jonesii]
MTSENLSPRVIKRLSKEFAELQGQPPEGIKLIINTDNLTDVQAWVEGPQGTPYEGGCFRVRLSLSSEFPNVPPQGTFLTKIFHPNVSKAGEICVNVLKKDWKKEYGIGHILLTIKCLLIDPNPESALNEEAGRLLLEDYNSYAKHAKLYTSIHGTNSKIQFGTTSSSAPTLGKQNAPPPTPVTISSKLPAVSQENSGIASGTVPPATGARDPAAPGSGIAGSCTPPGSQFA